MSAISDYERQRLKNLEENRRILDSIRQEQLTSFGGDRPPQIKKKKVESKNNDGESKSAVRVRRSSDSENTTSRRKSQRLSGKRPRYSLKDADAGDDSDDDFDAGEHDEDSDDEEYEGRKKCRSTLPKGPRPKVVIPKNRPNVYGAIPGVEVGRMWATRMECCADGIHRPTVAGIHAGPEGAYSIALSGGYEDDVDLGDCFTYTGEGGRELKGTASKPKNLRTAPQSKDQTLTRGNLALSLNVASRQPIRVIRGYKLDSPFAPEEGYRYDGLYSVEKFWACNGIAGFKVFKFALRRLNNQPLPPWVVSDSPSPQKSAKVGSDGEADEDEENDDKPKVLKVKLFNK